jgi:hypothetical protein
MSPDLAAERASGKRQKKLARSAEVSAYRFDRLGPYRYRMISVMDDIRLRVKVVNSLRFAPEVSSAHQKEIVERLDTLIDCLEARHMQRVPAVELEGASQNARSKRELLTLCHALTGLINICCLDFNVAKSIRYDTWDNQLEEFEATLMSWYPEDACKHWFLALGYSKRGRRLPF